jgi:hypothetical protein
MSNIDIARTRNSYTPHRYRACNTAGRLRVRY